MSPEKGKSYKRARFDNPATARREWWESGRINAFVSRMAIMQQPKDAPMWEPWAHGQVVGDVEAIALAQRPLSARERQNLRDCFVFVGGGRPEAAQKWFEQASEAKQREMLDFYRTRNFYSGGGETYHMMGQGIPYWGVNGEFIPADELGGDRVPLGWSEGSRV